MNQQILLNLKQNNNIDSDFIISDSNIYFVNLINNLINKNREEASNNRDIDFGVLPYKRSLILQGQKSFGKTAALNYYINQSNAIKITTKCKLDQFVDKYIEKNIEYNYFAIDDVENFANNIDLEKKLFHIFNLLNENNKYLLLTCTNIPKFNLPDLSSRINSLHKIKLTFPDDNLLKMIIFREFALNSLNVKEDVINYLLKITPRDMSKIIEITSLLNHYALEYKRNITIPLVKELFELI